MPTSVLSRIVLVHWRFIEEPGHEFIDMLGNARLGQSIADELARALEFHGLGQFEGSRDSFRFGSGGGKLVVELL